MVATKSLLSLALAGSAIAFGLASKGTAQTVPTDAKPLCPISAPAFNAMFESGTVTLNGVAKPADSTAVLSPNCGFFVWTEQMFLWLTSPAPRAYGGGSHIMFSPSFFTVSPPFTEAGQTRRTFIRNDPAKPIQMRLRATELGPHGLPVLMSKSGKLIEVEPLNPRKPVPPVVRLSSGKLATLSSVRLTPQGTAQFFVAGKPVQVNKVERRIVRPKTVTMLNGQRFIRLPEVSPTSIRARKLVVNGVPILLDLNNNVIDVEPGQADNGVLISQNGSLIYYIIEVNDVFAYYRTMVGDPVPANTIFPLTAASVAPVVAFAAGKGATITDPEALAIETKSSWVEASAVPNAADYVTVTATVPTFDKSNPNNWVENGQKTVKLAMVGIHVVGSTNGHGEMVWGTFEHLGNAPNAQYVYTPAVGPNKTVPQNTVGAWLFTTSGFSGTFNTPHPSWDLATKSITGTPVGPTQVLRMLPWGSDGSNFSLNTQVISATSAVITQLIPGDVRAKYFQLGTTWTKSGQPPNGANEVGTNLLANATIETFMQLDPSTGFASNCFTCHGTNTVAVSHVFDELKPLP